MSLVQLVYASQPFGFDEVRLYDLLVISRANNTRDDITGALICRADLYLQLLEGPEDRIAATFARIGEDDRHLGIRLLLSSPVSERLFPAWAMKDDPARSWMWTQQDVDNGALEAATPAEIRAVFERVANESMAELTSPPGPRTLDALAQGPVLGS
jgi:Sensors of blue-light using FAD